MMSSHPVGNERAFDAVVVDFGGVLTNPVQESLEAFATSLHIELQDVVRVMLPLYGGRSDDLVERFEKGTMDEADFSKELAHRFEEVCNLPVEADNLMTRIFAGMHLETSMLDALEGVRRQGVKTALLSNSWGMSGYPRDRFEALFDVVIISGEVGLRKPEPGIFQLTVHRLEVPPTKCVFVDDHPGHLQSAEALGMATILHVSPEQTLTRLSDLLGMDLTAR